MAVTETVSLILTGAESYISSTSQKFVKGAIYSVAKDEAIKLMSVKGDYDIRFFKKFEGEKGVKATPVDTTKKDVLPSQEEISSDMRKDAVEAHANSVAMHKADMVATASRGTETISTEVVAAEVTSTVVAATADTGEIDTAVQAQGKVRGKGVAV